MGRRKPGSSDRDGDDEDDDAKPESKPARDASDYDTKPIAIAKPPAQDPWNVETQPSGERARPSADDLPEIEPPEPRDEPWPDATPAPMRPVAPADATPRPHNPTIAAPVVGAPIPQDFGRPPDMPKTSAPPPLVLGDVENPAHMPGPREVPGGNPDDPASAPGRVPPGDSRSLRRGDEFALVYRVGTCVITRTGRVGTRGAWRVVEYPTSAAASNSYAKECSRFVSEGFSDYRE
jgi:hypothetical protein